MNQNLIDNVVQAVLYEGHILYPYRPSARRNLAQSKFGRVFPEAYSAVEHGAELSQMQTECLVEGPESATIGVNVRFLQQVERDIGALAAPLPKLPAPNNPDFFHVVPRLEVDGQLYQSWQESVERTVAAPVLTLSGLCAQIQTIPFSFAAARTIEAILDRSGDIAGVIVRRHETIEGMVELTAEPAGASAYKVTVRVVNRSSVPSAFPGNQDEIMMRTICSTHAILQARDAEFVSLIDPAEAHAKAAASCHNIGTWPILIGDEEKQERDAMLSSPVILYDYPTIAPEDAEETLEDGEIEEMLALENVTVTDEEKREVRHPGKRVRRTFAKTGALPDERHLQMKGAMSRANATEKGLVYANSRAFRGSARESVPVEDQPPA